MIKKLSIKNFKSIKDLEIDCSRINIFIGEPNTGKSNILEALGTASWCGYGGKLKNYVRFHGIQNLFYDDLLDHPVKIKIDKINLNILFENDSFKFISSSKDEKKTICILDYSGNVF